MYNNISCNGHHQQSYLSYMFKAAKAENMVRYTTMEYGHGGQCQFYNISNTSFGNFSTALKVM